MRGMLRIREEVRVCVCVCVCVCVYVCACFYRVVATFVVGLYVSRLITVKLVRHISLLFLPFRCVEKITHLFENIFLLKSYNITRVNNQLHIAVLIPASDTNRMMGYNRSILFCNVYIFCVTYGTLTSIFYQIIILKLCQ